MMRYLFLIIVDGEEYNTHYKAMTLDAFLARCERALEASGLSQARLSTILFGSGTTLNRLHHGGGVTVRVLDRAAERLTALEVARGIVSADGPA